MALDDQDLKIVEAIINLADVLGMDVVAEGVETAKEVEYLADLGCKFAQGFHFARPMQAAEASKMLKDNRKQGQTRRILENVLAPTG